MQTESIASRLDAVIARLERHGQQQVLAGLDRTDETAVAGFLGQIESIDLEEIVEMQPPLPCTRAKLQSSRELHSTRAGAKSKRAKTTRGVSSATPRSPKGSARKSKTPRSARSRTGAADGAATDDAGQWFSWNFGHYSG